MADEKKPADDAKKDEAAEGTEEEAPKKKKIPMMFIVAGVLVLVGLLLAGGIAYFVTSQLVSSQQAAGGGEAAYSKYHDPGVFVKLGDAKEGLLVNVGGIKNQHFLKIGIVFEMNPGKKDIMVEGVMNAVAETRMLDTVLQILRSEPLEGFDAMKQEELKDKLKTEVNRELGEGSVYNVYITSFILQ
ncbi:MAG: flagellar basal body-associated FliL family protein [Schwartzia sp.]|nr:flagellar basal body-associated FliL family protein [Schwartzia sp. (in: firmicutes)]